MDGRDRRGRGEGARKEDSEKQQLQGGGEGAAINSMTHSFCGGHFLTAFIKANLIILAP